MYNVDKNLYINRILFPIRVGVFETLVSIESSSVLIC